MVAFMTLNHRLFANIFTFGQSTSSSTDEEDGTSNSIFINISTIALLILGLIYMMLGLFCFGPSMIYQDEEYIDLSSSSLLSKSGSPRSQDSTNIFFSNKSPRQKQQGGNYYSFLGDNGEINDDDHEENNAYANQGIDWLKEDYTAPQSSRSSKKKKKKSPSTYSSQNPELTRQLITV